MIWDFPWGQCKHRDLVVNDEGRRGQKQELEGAVAELEGGQVEEQRQPADAVRMRYCSPVAALPKP